jgi:hypothetical protein
MQIRSKNGTRTCKKCRIIKPLTEFAFLTVSQTYCRECKQCHKQHERARREHNENTIILLKQGNIKCNGCKEVKSTSEFYKDSSKRLTGLSTRCKDCHEKSRKLESRKRKLKDWSLRKNYGISIENYEEKLLFQRSKCAICQGEITFTTACVDHCHSTGKVRDLLCVNCNWGIGSFKENIDTMKAGIKYIEKHDEKAQKAKYKRLVHSL